MTYSKPTQSALAGAFAFGPLFDFAAVDVDSAFDALVAAHSVHLAEVVEYVAPAPVVPESFETAWARESSAIIGAHRGTRKRKGAK